MEGSAAAAADKCQKIIKQAGKRFVDDSRAALANCALDLLRCTQTKPADAQCRSKAADVCTRVFAKVADSETQLADRITRKCAVDALSFADVLSEAGLGFSRVAGECTSRFGDTLTDIDAVSRCIADQHRCEAERLVDFENPRAGELLRTAGIPAAMDSCLADRGGNGEDIGDPTGDGKDLAKCSTAIKQAGARFLSRKLKSLERCVDRVFTCVQTASDFDACRADAENACDKAFADIASEEAKVSDGVDKKCAGLDALSGAPNGLTFQALASECQTYGVTSFDGLQDYEACLVRQHQCRVEEVVRFEAPRAEELLGLVGRSLVSGFCPSEQF